MDKNQIVKLGRSAYCNKSELEKTNSCGCYYCQKTFQLNDITEWTDEGQTALCPYCGVDSVIPNPTEENLKELHKYYFDGKIYFFKEKNKK